MNIQASVIITSFNQQSTISRAIESIISQNVDFDFEIIIGDDCSSDNTKLICEEYQHKYSGLIKVIIQPENLGVGANWASCVKVAKGEFIFTCAADDFWHNRNKMRVQVEYMNLNIESGLVYTDYHVLNSETGKLSRNKLQNSNINCLTGFNLMKFVFSGNVPILTLTTCFRKALFDKYVPVDDYINLRFPLEDWPTWLILSKYTSINFIPISTATYTKGHDSISNPLFIKKAILKFEKEHIMYKYLCGLFPEDLHYDASSYFIYSSTNLLRLSYILGDYSYAKLYSNELVNNNHKSIFTFMSSNLFLFHFMSTCIRTKRLIFKF